MAPIPSQPHFPSWTPATPPRVADLSARLGARPDLGPDNAWRVLALRLWKTDWCVRLTPFNQSLVALHCRTLAEDFERNRLCAPHTIRWIDVEAWIRARTDSDTVAAGYRVVFRRLLGAQRSPRIHFIEGLWRVQLRSSKATGARRQVIAAASAPSRPLRRR